MERQKRQAEYLQAMGVDLYAHRHSAVVTDAMEPTPADELVESDTPEQTVSLELVEAATPKVKVDVESILARSEPVSSSSNATQQETVRSERSNSPELDQQGLKAVPLNFLWQQQGRYLFLSAQERQPNQQESKLLDAIVRSISPSAYSESGEGKWPLSDSQPTTETETQDFLNSFVQGRSELCGTEVVLILFGEKSQKQFSEVEGSFQDLLGKQVENEGKICEFRIVPSLQTMLEKPQSKSLTWQAIRDLRASAKSV